MSHLSPRCVLVAAALLAGCSWAQAPPLAQGTVPETSIAAGASVPFRLGPGDRLSVQVFAHAENSTPEEGGILDSEGRLDLALLGPVPLAGLTLDEARELIRDELRRYVREPQVSVTVLEFASRRFYLFGEVEQAGPFPLDRPLTALQALSLGGGFRPGADRKQVALLRGTREHLEVYFFDAATPGPDGLVAIRPDDFLFVRLSGAGTFREQILPIVQGLVPPLAALASVVLIVDRLNQ